MFQSLGPGELVTIGLVALIVFGPHRLPEMARRLGGYVRELRRAATEIKEGLDAEVRELREPFEAVQKDLTKPVTEVKQTLSETADIVKKGTAPAADALNRAVDDVRSAGTVQWVGPQPKTGASPGEAREGMNDPVPDEIRDAPEVGEAVGDAKSASTESSGQDES